MNTSPEERMDFHCIQALRNNLTSVLNVQKHQTCQDQKKVEDLVREKFESFKESVEAGDNNLPKLNRTFHEKFLVKGLFHLSESYQALDASQPWLVYWILHSMSLLGIHIMEETAKCIVEFLGKCQLEDGGFGGGPQQIAHLATTYAAVNALCILGTDQAFKLIKRDKLYEFLMRMHMKDGSFQMHDNGESDIRGIYCAASVARLTNIATPELFDGSPEWLVKCQTYEGGFGGVPGAEAHGGYSFCGLAALVLLGHEKLCDLKSLLRWTANRQMPLEGGFQGRTNKLVDGCYSFWQGGAFPLLHIILGKEGDKVLSPTEWMFNQRALQEYILICCQSANGGLIDKPGKNRDFYHTAYCLSGLSVAQHFADHKLRKTVVVGDPANEIKQTHPVFNIVLEAVTRANLFYNNDTSSPDPKSPDPGSQDPESSASQSPHLGSQDPESSASQSPEPGSQDPQSSAPESAENKMDQ